jgi:hypothetical protein
VGASHDECLPCCSSCDPDPLRNPGLISITFGFLCGIVGTLISKETQSDCPLRITYSDSALAADDAEIG